MIGKRKPKIIAHFTFESKDGRKLEKADLDKLGESLTRALIDKAEPNDVELEDNIISEQS